MSEVTTEDQKPKPYTLEEIEQCKTKLWTAWCNTCSESANTPEEELHTELNDGWDLFEAVHILEYARAELSRSAAVPQSGKHKRETVPPAGSDDILQCSRCNKRVFHATEDPMPYDEGCIAALSEPSQPSAADKPVAALDIKRYSMVTSGIFSTLLRMPQGEYIKVEDLAQFAGALGAGENGIVTEMFTIDERLHGMHESNKSIPSLRLQRKRLEQHLSEIQQLKQICEGGS